MGIQDRRSLIYYKEQVLGELERIDTETETVHMKLLETYLEVNGNMQEAASGVIYTGIRYFIIEKGLLK